MWGNFNKGEEVNLPQTYYYQKVFNLLESHFNYDFEKTYFWFIEPQKELGTIPENMFLWGRGEEVLEYVKKIVKVCDFCDKPCENEQCFAKEER